MIENEALKEIWISAKDISTVAEIYSADAVPTADGFDPADALDCFAAVDGITFLGVEYKRLIKSFTNPSRSITSEINSGGVSFSNLDNYISQFEFEHGFEGLILVVRCISRSQSVSLSTSQILCAIRCEKPKSGKKESLSVSAKSPLDSLEVNIPRRKFSPDDYKGRESTDPEFEGFPFMPQTGYATYSERVKRGGILGILGFKKTVGRTLAYSSFSDLDANKPLPEVFGMTQILGTHLAYQDVGSYLRIKTAFCEGEIADIINARSTNPAFPLDPASYAECYGRVGVLNTDDPAWVAPGYFSRTAHIRGKLNNSDVAVTDEAADIAAIIKGRLLNVWNGTDWEDVEWANNAASVWRYLLTGGDYFNLDENWIDDEKAGECWEFNDERIFNVNSSDFLFLD